MFAEYALEPSLLATKESARHFVTQFGFENGRLIAKYPRTWEILVLEQVQSLPDQLRKTLVEYLLRLKRCCVDRGGNWQPTESWLNNAISEHKRSPFAAILSSSNPQNLDFILTEGDADPLSTHSSWQALRSREIPRNVQSFINALAPLLRCSRRVLFVDPNFTPKDRGFRDGLAAFLKALVGGGGKWLAKDIFYVTGDERSTPAEFQALCKSHLTAIIPQGMAVTFNRCKANQIHDRFVITDVGGLKFGQGLDTAGALEAIQNVMVTLLDQATSARLFDEYTGQISKYTFESESKTVVTGTFRLR